MKISVSDIETNWKGFSVKKVKKLSDSQLNELEAELSNEIDVCEYANIEEYRYLTVGWFSKCTTTEEEKIIICKILNEII